jgi:hypothetical protein
MSKILDAQDILTEARDFIERQVRPARGADEERQMTTIEPWAELGQTKSNSWPTRSA